MKKSRFTDSQIMAILKQAEAGTPVSELCREHGMSSASFYKWRAKYVDNHRRWRRAALAPPESFLGGTTATSTA